jgi:hypothetical protein
MRYPRYKPETILRLRDAGPVQRPDGKVKRYVYNDPLPEKHSQHARQRGIYRWGAALIIPFAIACATDSMSREAQEKRRTDERRKDMIMKSMKR